MNTKDTKSGPLSAFILIICAAAVAALFLATGPSTPSSLIESSAAPTNGAIKESLDRLSTSDNPVERMHTIRFLGTRIGADNDAVLSGLEKSLRTDKDALVRSAAANSIAKLAQDARVSSQKEGSELNFAQIDRSITDTLERAFENEKDSTVRRCIIEASGELDSQKIESLLESATRDSDPAVREAAINARLKRTMRARVMKLG